MKKPLLFASLILIISVLALSPTACWPTSTDTTTESEAPTIVAFSASSTEITEGESATLIWNVTEATSVTINGMSEPHSGSRTLSPASLGNHTYTLKATNANGTVTKTQVLKVTP